MKLVVGLGNPGPKYDGTRHNIGYAVVDYLAAAPGVGRWRSKFEAQVTEAVEGTEQVLLMKPETFMNLSGRAVRAAFDFYKLDVKDVLIVCDDIALPLGKLRVRARGSHGGQNGLRNIQDMLGTQDYSRLRVGIGSPGEQWDAADYVLSRFKPGERAVVEDAIARAAQAVLVWVRHGVDECMNRFNADPQAEKSKKDKPAKDKTDKTPPADKPPGPERTTNPEE
jgi:peptidyl-tRNA hydrolase, PTH1 family